MMRGIPDQTPLRRAFGLLPAAWALAACVVLAQPVWAQKQGGGSPPSAQPQFVDGIAAVVDKQIISVRALYSEAALVRNEMQRQGVAVPDDDQLLRQVLQRMIDDEIERQAAERQSIRITDDQVLAAARSVAQRNSLSLDRLRAEIERSGTRWDDYLNQLRVELRLEALRHKVLESMVAISEAEVDHFLRTQGHRLPEAQPGAAMVVQTHARHILLKHNRAFTDDQLRERLEQVRQRVVYGEPFEELARRYSEDTTAQRGGDLDWVMPGTTVPAFEEAMNQTPAGEVSPPIRTQYGWHLIQVVERREENMSEQFRRMQARQVLFEQRAEPALQDWLEQLRGQTFIDNRLDPSASSRARR